VDNVTTSGNTLEPDEVKSERTRMKTMETTEEMSSVGMEKRVERRNWRQIDPCAREKPMADWKKVLANLGSGKRITKKAYAGRGQETIWEMSDKGSI
jgi:hypothetical protein